MKLFGLCINWKVLAGLGVVALGLFAFAPKLATAALPYLVLAICPLSMLLMMGGMQAMNRKDDTSPSPEAHLARLKVQQRELASEIARLEATHNSPLEPTQHLS